MSQTETLLLVALGFAFALVLAMIFGFAIWSAANRWSAYKRRREVPTTILDMQAEREGLRAQNAMTKRRLEFLLEDARTQAAEKTAQVTRHRNRAIIMSKDLIAKDAEIASLRALAAELTAETNKRARIIGRLTGREVANLRSFDMPVPEGTKPAVLAPQKTELGADAAPLDRIKAKIAELNALSAQIADQQSVEGRAVEAVLTARELPREPLTLSALRETDEEVSEAQALAEANETDRAMADATAPDEKAALSEKAAAAGEAPFAEAPPEPPPPERKMTLAERFRSMKDGIGG